MSAKICSVSTCDRAWYSRDWCQAHYKRWRRHGDVFAEFPVGRPVNTCEIDGCDEHVDSKGLCHGHDQRVRRNGDVQADIPLGRRRQPELCTVEDCDRHTQAKGLCGTHYARAKKAGDVQADLPIRIVTGEGWLSHGYWGVSVPPELRHLTNGEAKIAEHRLVMAKRLGRALTPYEVVHHKNGIRTDNRIGNLELWSTYQPKGQRIEDKVEWALEVLAQYRPDLFARLGPV